LTAGEPAGIGPDLCLAAAAQLREFPLVCIADRELLAARNARQVLHLIEAGVDGCRSGEFSALVTAPVQMSIINVDHGTALSLAGTGAADAGSLQAALQLATQLAIRHATGA
jgi:4-hydroxythreonine-4-phosphate dehydrogenase